MAIQKFECKSCKADVIYDPGEGVIVIPFLKKVGNSISMTKSEMEMHNISTITLKKVYLKCTGNPQHEHIYYVNELS
ncbi:hypothetical protein KK083_07375 [Fulvivirgaceae bacterium PWU4]|uniref:Uncharacterized protein n=1 Tax=Chryseosolibacter histidini TaxID=2782349 RepID=A0AAP2DJU9_9BACT|nr:hypothetical protein [Chryseosolibacter histidini]MBT1696688.1 hypothetical protein [Chryseosolibacter histidini]